jgi:carbon storage regulator
MLVMTRKAGERIVIDGSIVVTVLQTRRGRVRLGIDAPGTVRIRRDELAGLGEKKRPAVLAAASPGLAVAAHGRSGCK